MKDLKVFFLLLFCGFWLYMSAGYVVWLDRLYRLLIWTFLVLLGLAICSTIYSAFLQKITLFNAVVLFVMFVVGFLSFLPMVCRKKIKN